MASHDERCPVVCEAVIKAQRDVDSAWIEIRRHKAWLVGTDEEEMGGMRAQLAAIQKRIDQAIIWAKALVICTLALMVILGIGPDRFQRLLGMIK